MSTPAPNLTLIPPTMRADPGASPATSFTKACLSDSMYCPLGPGSDEEVREGTPKIGAYHCPNPMDYVIQGTTHGGWDRKKVLLLLPSSYQTLSSLVGSDPVEQPISYEWVPPSCSKCKCFGHVAQHCPLPQRWVRKTTAPQEGMSTEPVLSASTSSPVEQNQAKEKDLSTEAIIPQQTQSVALAGNKDTVEADPPIEATMVNLEHAAGKTGDGLVQNETIETIPQEDTKIVSQTYQAPNLLSLACRRPMRRLGHINQLKG